MEINELRSEYNQFLWGCGIDQEENGWNNRRLKKMLISHYGDRIGFQNQLNRSKSQLVYSTRVTVGQAVQTVQQLNESLNDSAIESEMEYQKLSTEETVLHQAAMILHSELTATEGLKSWPPEAEDVTEEKAEAMLPSKLKRFLQWVTNGESETTVSKDSENLNRKILSVGQDLLYITSRGRALTPKHLALANSLNQTGHSKLMMNIVNRLGHCISHDQLLRINTAVATKIEEANGEVIIPGGIQTGVFTQLAADNNDLLEEILDGKNTTHSTNMIVLQRRLPDVPEGRMNSSAVPPRRPRTITPPSETLPKVLTSMGKRENPKELNYMLSATKPHQQFSAPAELDTAWLLARNLPQKLFCPEAEGDEQAHAQMVPSWAGFNSMAAVGPKPQCSVIGYCPVINAPSTEYTTVYKILENACKITEKVGQAHTVLVLDQAIYCKALDIITRRSEDFPLPNFQP